MAEERRIRILRLLEYVGPESWVRDTLARNAVKGVYHIDHDRWISGAILGEASEFLPAYPRIEEWTPPVPLEYSNPISMEESESIRAPNPYDYELWLSSNLPDLSEGIQLQ